MTNFQQAKIQRNYFTIHIYGTHITLRSHHSRACSVWRGLKRIGWGWRDQIPLNPLQYQIVRGVAAAKEVVVRGRRARPEGPAAALLDARVCVAWRQRENGRDWSQSPVGFPIAKSLGLNRRMLNNHATNQPTRQLIAPTITEIKC